MLRAYDSIYQGPSVGLRPYYRTWAEATNWPRPDFTPSRIVPFTDLSSFNSAVAGIRAGDWLVNQSTSGFDVAGEYTGFAGLGQLSSPARVDLGWHGVNAVRFNYGGTSEFPSVWIKETGNLQIFGGDVTNPTGAKGIWVMASDTFTVSGLMWWDFYVHDTGEDSIQVQPRAPSGGQGSMVNCSFKGEGTNWGLQDAKWDPHGLAGEEWGTGFHGAQVWDISGGTFQNNTLAFYGHNGPTGACIQFGVSDSTGNCLNNTFYVKADTLTHVSTSQTAANAIQTWGTTPLTGTVVEFIDARNLQGQAYDDGNSSGSSSVMIRHARAHNTNLNTAFFGTNPFDSRGTLQDCLKV